jgi:hypothetical protein
MNENWQSLWEAIKADRYIFGAFILGFFIGAALF